MASSQSTCQAERNAHYRSTLTAYAAAINRQDVDAICALFAESAEIIDPIGGPRHIFGKNDIREFYEYVVTKLRIAIRGPVSGSFGNAAAMAVDAVVGNEILNNISVAKFDDDGRIVEYVTFWGPGDRHEIAS